MATSNFDWASLADPNIDIVGWANRQNANPVPGDLLTEYFSAVVAVGGVLCYVVPAVIMRVARNGHFRCLKYILESASTSVDVRVLLASQYGKLEWLKYLLEHRGATVDSRAALLAAGAGYIECLKYLLEDRGAPVDTTASQMAAQNGQLECLEFLAEGCYPMHLFDRKKVHEYAAKGIFVTDSMCLFPGCGSNRHEKGVQCSMHAQELVDILHPYGMYGDTARLTTWFA